MTFAFGKRAYYLYWKQADGRVTWGANLPSKTVHVPDRGPRDPAAAVAADAARHLRGRPPGHLLAGRTTPDNLDITGAIHIMPPVPHWHRARMALVGDAVHAPSNSTGQGASLAIESAVQLARCLRDLPDAAIGVRRLRDACGATASRRSPNAAPGRTARRPQARSAAR